MSLVDEVLAYMRSVKGVVDIVEMDDDISSRVWDIEKTVKTKSKTDYQNVGYDIVMEMDHRFCVFYDGGYMFQKRARLKLVDSYGKVMGTNLFKDEIESYRTRDDVIWVSEDFVVFPQIMGEGEEAFVLCPYEIAEISENVSGVVNPLGTSPTPSSDVELKRWAGRPLTADVFTSVVAFNDPE